MSSEERKKILQMVEEGKITAEQAASLMRAIEADAESEEGEIEAFEAAAAWGQESDSSDFEQVKARALRFAMIPLWIGIFITVLSAWGIYSVQQNSGMNFWFFLLMIPLLLGVLLIALGASGQTSKWLYVNVDRRYTVEGPRTITLGFPLPL
jgi:hypothetical protein